MFYLKRVGPPLSPNQDQSHFESLTIISPLRNQKVESTSTRLGPPRKIRRQRNMNTTPV